MSRKPDARLGQIDFSEGLLTPKQVTEHLNVRDQTLRKWRHQRKGPPFVQLGRGGHVRYPMANLKAWLETGDVLGAD